jgi:hypothetical protein
MDTAGRQLGAQVTLAIPDDPGVASGGREREEHVRQ